MRSRYWLLFPALYACGELDPSPYQVQYVVFDPTIELTDNEFESILTSAPILQSNGTTRVCAIVFIVTPLAQQQPGQEPKCYDRGRTFDLTSSYEARLTAGRDSLRSLLRTAWSSTKKGEGVHRTSCILGTLSDVGIANALRIAPDVGVPPTRSLLIISDLMEACPEPIGNRVWDFEDALPDSTSVGLIRSVELTGFLSVEVRMAHSPHIDTRQQRESLKSFWISVLVNWGIPEAGITIK